MKAIEQEVAGYKPGQHVVELLGKARVLLLVAISGGGKDTVKHHLLHTGRYQHIISYTTRAPRYNHGKLEQDGVDYHFIDLKAAERLLKERSFIEADMYADHLYGTGTDDIEKAYKENKIATTDITIEGALHYLKLAPSVKAVFLVPPSYEVWMMRLLSRYDGRQDGRDIHLRLQEAVDEIELAMRSKSMYIVVNDDLEEVLKRVDAIAHDKPVEPHSQKAMEVSKNLLKQLREELAELV